jgi:hypothetical protein
MAKKIAKIDADAHELAVRFREYERISRYARRLTLRKKWAHLTKPPSIQGSRQSISILFSAVLKDDGSEDFDPNDTEARLIGEA